MKSWGKSQLLKITNNLYFIQRDDKANRRLAGARRWAIGVTASCA